MNSEGRLRLEKGEGGREGGKGGKEAVKRMSMQGATKPLYTQQKPEQLIKTPSVCEPGCWALHLAR